LTVELELSEGSVPFRVRDWKPMRYAEFHGAFLVPGGTMETLAKMDHFLILQYGERVFVKSVIKDVYEEMLERDQAKLIDKHLRDGSMQYPEILNTFVMGSS
jgi:hypothetical protein